ncbi:MAG TPA: sulfite exporter TauE/SafE family protein [Thermoanaerobaculia bacterium]|nr:sulfite exporter TauE/SafE family protein [Thermoanaerobaculia bacterium]
MKPDDWLLAAGLSAAASMHCVGMCGGFVLALAAGERKHRLRRLADQLLLQVGKGSSYAFLGALAGALGAKLVTSPAFAWSGRVLAILAAVALALTGFTLLGLRRGTAGAWSARLVAPFRRWIGPLLTQGPAGAPLVVGLAMGFLPCPLVYTGLAAAAATGSAGAGAAILGGVALGTVPALTGVALLGVSLPQGTRRNLARAGGVLLLVMAVVTLMRGLSDPAGPQ